VTKALLTITGQDQVTDGARLPTEVARSARRAATATSGRSAMPTAACPAAPRWPGTGVKNLYRIENVSTKRAERITANEEERVRQGYEMQTTLQFAEAEGKLQMVTTVVEDAGPAAGDAVRPGGHRLAHELRLAAPQESHPGFHDEPGHRPLGRWC
jgi:hypothetical protein